MKRNEENKVAQLLKTAHANRLSSKLPASWRTQVIKDIERTRSFPQTASDFERVAPGFTLAATTVSVVAFALAGLLLSELPDQLMLAYTTRSFNLTLLSWATL